MVITKGEYSNLRSEVLSILKALHGGGVTLQHIVEQDVHVMQRFDIRFEYAIKKMVKRIKIDDTENIEGIESNASDNFIDTDNKEFCSERSNEPHFVDEKKLKKQVEIQKKEIVTKKEIKEVQTESTKLDFFAKIQAKRGRPKKV